MRAHIAIAATPAAYTHYEKNRNHSFAVGEPRSAHDRRVKFIVKRTGCTESYRILPGSRRALSRGRRQNSPDTASARGSRHAGLPGGSFPHLPRLHRHVQSLAHWLQNWRRDYHRGVAGADGGGSPLLCRPFLSRALVLWLQVAWWRALHGSLARSQPHISSPKRPRGSSGERFATKDPRICPSDQNIPKQPKPFLPQPK